MKRSYFTQKIACVRMMCHDFDPIIWASSRSLVGKVQNSFSGPYPFNGETLEVLTLQRFGDLKV